MAGEARTVKKVLHRPGITGARYADRRLTIAYVMNKLVPCMIVGPIAAALVERVYDIANR